MFNVLLDPVPTEWRGISIDSDFRTGILVSQCLQDEELTKRERIGIAARLLFPKECPEISEALEAVEWFLSEYDHDNPSDKKTDRKVRVLDFDIDQWRIYAAFRQQYGIDLSCTKMHWFIFMGLLVNLEDCNFTRVIDIRKKDVTDKMGKEEKQELRKAKKMYALSQTSSDDTVPETEKEKIQEAQEAFLRMINKR